MQRREYYYNAVAQKSDAAAPVTPDSALSPETLAIQWRARPVSFGVKVMPLVMDPNVIMQRADEVNTILGILVDTYISAVLLIGNPGAGKSTLAALLYQRLLLAKQTGLSAPKHMVWLGLNTYTTLPDMIAAILSGISYEEPGFFLLKPDQQIAVLLHALRRPQEGALIVLDQFESMLHPETSQGVAGRGALAFFLEMLQTDLGSSRILLTAYHSPYEHLERTRDTVRVRSYLVSRISMPEGVALLQWRGVTGSHDLLSLVWQRCAGHVFALVLFRALMHLSGLTLDDLLNTPEYSPLWQGEVTLQIIATIYQYLHSIQYQLMHTLSLFSEPVPLEAVSTTLVGHTTFTSDTTVLSNLYTSLERELRVLTELGLVQSSSNALQDVPQNVPEGTSISICQVYDLHPLLRQFALEHYHDDCDNRTNGALQKFETPSEVRTQFHYTMTDSVTQKRMLAAGHVCVATYYHNLALKHYPPRQERTRLYDIEPLIAAVRHLCLGWHWQLACDILFAEGLHESLIRWGAWNTLVGLYTALLPPFGVLRRHDEGLVCSHLGMLYGRLGEYQQGQAYFEQAIAIFHEVGNRHGEVMTLANMGEICRASGNWGQARSYLEQALSMNKQYQDTHLQCILLHNLGLLYHNAKDYQIALSLYIQALRLTYQLHAQDSKGTILTNLGILLYEQGRQNEAIAVLLAALQVRQTLQDPHTPLLERFLFALEQKMGKGAYDQLSQMALSVQRQVFSLMMG